MPNSEEVLEPTNAAFVNGRWSESEVYSDRGLNFGDGLFETVLVYQGQAPLWQLHKQRLEQGLCKLSINVKLSLVEQYFDEYVAQLPAHPKIIIKIIITRGSGGKGYTSLESSQPKIIFTNRILEFSNNYSNEGVELKVSSTRLSINPNLAGLKHLSKLDYVLAAQNFDGVGKLQPLLLDFFGHLVESLHHNIFFFKDNLLCTPDLELCGVAGVMRKWVLDSVQHNPDILGSESKFLGVSVGRFELSDLIKSDEIFICNSVRGIWPVTKVDQTSKSIGPNTMALQKFLALNMGGAYEC